MEKDFQQDLSLRTPKWKRLSRHSLIKFVLIRKSECYKCLCTGLEEFDPATLMPVALAIPEQDAEKSWFS